MSFGLNPGRVRAGIPAPGAPDAKRALGGQVHLWLVRPSSWNEAFAGDRVLLSPDERAAAAAFPSGYLRERYAIAHCAVRRLLSLYDDRPPESWVFRRSRRGRPRISGDSRLRFSLSYGDDLIAIAIARDVRVGIDIVSTRRCVDAIQIAEHAFAPDEITALRSLRADTVRDRFFEYWALKEAYAKATGAGFWDKPRRYAFSFSGPGAIGFRHDGNQDSGQWQFVLAPAPQDHRLAVAVRSGAGRPRNMITRVAPGGEVVALVPDRTFPGSRVKASLIATGNEVAK